MLKHWRLVLVILGWALNVRALPVTTAEQEMASVLAESQRYSKLIREVTPDCEKLVVAGDMAAANAKLMAVFPASDRTPVQSFLLGNTLFNLDRSNSYALHRRAALSAPANGLIQYEWAIEQHRAGEYAAALSAYKIYSAARPDEAVPYALMADCYLHLDQLKAAAEAWHRSETATDGTVEQMENMICEVKREAIPYARREALLAGLKQKPSIDAACELIALDCQFPRDWWNRVPAKKQLANDWPVVQAALKLSADDLSYRELAAAIDCATLEEPEAGTVRPLLGKYQFFTDNRRTLPADGRLLTIILQAALDSEVIDDHFLHQELGPLLLVQARRGRDADMWKAALLAAPTNNPAGLMALEREAWRITENPSFAHAVLVLDLQAGELTARHPDMVTALKQFPMDGPILRMAVLLAEKDKSVTTDLLARAAKAEFSHFSSSMAPATAVNRPRSDYLRQYFAELGQRLLSAPENGR